MWELIIVTSFLLDDETSFLFTALTVASRYDDRMMNTAEIKKNDEGLEMNRSVEAQVRASNMR